MKKMQITACALAVLTITSLPSLAKDIEVKVTGSVTPSGCTPTLTSDGTVDYGIIKSDSLTLDAYTTLEKKRVGFNHCLRCTGEVGAGDEKWSSEYAGWR
jgi:type 1 fimbria pilin